MARARTTDPETSHEAAATVKQTDAHLVLYGLASLYVHPVRGRLLFTLKQAVYNIRETHGPDRISEQGIRSRIAELREAGYVEWALNEEGEQQFYYGPRGSRRHRYLRLTLKGEACVMASDTPRTERKS